MDSVLGDVVVVKDHEWPVNSDLGASTSVSPNDGGLKLSTLLNFSGCFCFCCCCCLGGGGGDGGGGTASGIGCEYSGSCEDSTAVARSSAGETAAVAAASDSSMLGPA